MDNETPKHDWKLHAVIMDDNGTKVRVYAKDIEFSAWEQECEVCGSHGRIEMRFLYDGRHYEIRLSEW